MTGMISSSLWYKSFYAAIKPVTDAAKIALRRAFRFRTRMKAIRGPWGKLMKEEPSEAMIL